MLAQPSRNQLITFGQKLHHVLPHEKQENLWQLPKEIQVFGFSGGNRVHKS